MNPCREPSRKPANFGVEFCLTPLHLVHLTTDVFEFFDDLCLESVKDVVDDIFAEYLLLQSREQFLFQNVALDANAIGADRIAAAKVHRAAIGLDLMIALAPRDDLKVRTAALALQDAGEEIGRIHCRGPEQAWPRRYCSIAYSLS
jgi:hypothetical protein